MKFIEVKSIDPKKPKDAEEVIILIKQGYFSLTPAEVGIISFAISSLLFLLIGLLLN